LARSARMFALLTDEEFADQLQVARDAIAARVAKVGNHPKRPRKPGSGRPCGIKEDFIRLYLHEPLGMRLRTVNAILPTNVASARLVFV
jgi:hypothetical protein